MYKHYLCILAIALLTSGCSRIVMLMYGMHDPHALTLKQTDRLNAHAGAQPENSFVIDTNYIAFVYNNDTINLRGIKKNHIQPVQGLYFAPGAEYASVYYINCYAGGFPNLNWNKNDAFRNFPPKQQAPVDSLFTLSQLIKYLNESNHKQLKLQADQWCVVIIWSHFMKRQSMRLIRYIQGNLTNHKVNATVVYVNADNLFAAGEHVYR